MLGNSWFKKLKPLPSMIGMGGGATSLGQHGIAAPAWDGFTTTQTFSYTGSDQSWTVPVSTTTIGFFIWGAAGASGPSPAVTNYKIGGSGGYTEGIITVTGGETLWIVVGQGGVIGNTSPRVYGGGGAGGHTNRAANEWGVSGGGLSGIFAAPGPVGGTTMPTGSVPKAIAIAGGGGGYGLNSTFRPTPGGSTPPMGDPDSWSAKGALIPAPLGGWMWPGGPGGAAAPYPIDPTGVTFDNVFHHAGGGGLRGENAPGNQYGGDMPGGFNIRFPFTGSPYAPQPVAGGGSQSAGGYGVDGAEDGDPGTALNGGDAGEAGYEYAGGGGGGGWYGGGGGGADWPSAYGAGGAGSGYIGNTALEISNVDNTWTGTSPNGRDYSLAYTVCPDRIASAPAVFDPGGVVAYSSPNSAPYMPTTAGKALIDPGWIAGEPGYIVIRY